jgi:hypothetical protein
MSFLINYFRLLGIGYHYNIQAEQLESTSFVSVPESGSSAPYNNEYKSQADNHTKPKSHYEEYVQQRADEIEKVNCKIKYLNKQNFSLKP